MRRLQYDDYIFSKYQLWMWMFPNIKPLLAAHYQFKQKSCCWPLLFHVTRELDCGIREGFKCQQSIVLCIVVTSISVLWHGFGTRWQIICCQFFYFAIFPKKLMKKNITSVIKISFTKQIICFLAKLRPLHPHMWYLFGRLLICPSTCKHLKEEVQTIFLPAEMDCD